MKSMSRIFIELYLDEDVGVLVAWYVRSAFQKAGLSCVPYEKVLVSYCQLCSCGDAWDSSSNLEAVDSASPSFFPKRLSGTSD